MAQYLVLNPGSSSLRAAYITVNERTAYTEQHTIYYDNHTQTYIINNTQTKTIQHKQITDNSSSWLNEIIAFCYMHNPSPTAIAIRIVAPGIYFTKHRVINEAYIKQLEAAEHQAPLHIPSTRQLIHLIQQTYRHTLLVGISDSAFHATRQSTYNPSYHYGISPTIAHKYGIYRYGYHGIAVQSVMRELDMQTENQNKKVIVCHLGSGSSITAIRNKTSIDTSMGFSPLEGLVSSTRSGSIDPTAVLYLSEQSLHPSKSNKELATTLFKQSGLYSISGYSSDMKQLLMDYHTQPRARFAVDLYCQRAIAYIGRSIALLNGFNTLIFSGGIGQYAPTIRHLICKNLSFTGLELNPEYNQQTQLLQNLDLLSTNKSSITVFRANVNEQQELARQAHQLVKTLHPEKK